jgi:hypothetical protein
MLDPAYYRERAKKIREVAETVAFEETESLLLNLAAQYDRLAVRAAEAAEVAPDQSLTN